MPGLHRASTLGFLTAAVAISAIAYEAVRSRATGHSDLVPPPLRPSIVALWVVVGSGYAVRGVTGLALALSLAQHVTPSEVMDDSALRAYVTRLIETEIMPLLPAVPGIDLEDYKTTLLERLANPKMGDELRRLCRRGSTKVPSYLLPSLTEAVRDKRPHALLTLALAGWLRYLRGVDWAGREIEIEDARRDELTELVGGGVDPRPILQDRTIFGDLADDEGFADRLEQTMLRLQEHGPRATAQQLVAAPQEAGAVS